MRLVFLSFAFLFSVIYFSQQNPSYTILNNNCTARNSSLGGYPIGVIDSDPSLAIFLPSNLSKLNTDKLVINYNNHFADSDFGMINYNLSLKKKGNFSATLIYNNYGKFEYYNSSGIPTGNTFTANDWIFQIGHSKKLHDFLQIGINFKIITSNLEQYSSVALASDISTTYHNKNKRIGGYLLFSNIGTSLTNYNSLSSQNNRLPFNSIFGINTELKHAPVRFLFTYNHLNKWKIISNNHINSSDVNRINEFSNQLLNHFVVATELLFSENFNLRFGYDLLSRNELQPQSRPGTTGISWGLGLKVKSFKINYSNSKYHFSGISNNLTIIKSFKTTKPKD